jgi:carboxyl-terminal processing protease
VSDTESSKTVTLRSLVLAILVIAAGSMIGGVFGPHIGSAAAASGKEAVKDYSHSLVAVLEIVQQNLAAEGDWNRAIYLGAIPAMLNSLDPHSQFFDPEAFRRLREEQRGHYAGVGMLIRQFRGRTVVDQPFPDTPAFRGGVRPNDIIDKIDGQTTEGMNVTEVAQAVKGPEGTAVRLSLLRQGTSDPIAVELVRAEVHRPSIPNAFFLDRSTGYLKIDSFNENTAAELDEALDGFDTPSLQGLILDLRGNNGGLLSAGVHVADRFLDRGQAIVSHRGRASRERVYSAREGNGGQRYPMIVLVDCQSASASEIVAGALQDHDRALIVGTNTFGKGLVQSVFNLPETAGLVLTTARYYTPTGRLIQRPYDNRSLGEYYADPCRGGFRPSHEDARLTDNGRPVYGGGGIAPDIELPPATLDEFQQRLQWERVFEGYAEQYRRAHPEAVDTWRAGSKEFDELRQYLVADNIPFAAEGIERHRDYILRMITRHVFSAWRDIYAGSQVDAQLDPAVRRALELLPQASTLLRKDGGALAQQHSTPNSRRTQ